MSNVYIIKVRSGTEKKVITDVNTKLKLNNLLDEVEEFIMPSEEKDGKEKPILNGYLFLKTKTETMSPELHNCIKSTNNVASFLMQPNPKRNAIRKVLTITEEQIGKIKKQEIQQKVIGKEIEVGSQVKYGNFTGSVTKINKDKSTILLSVVVFKQETIIEIDINDSELKIIN